MSSAMMDDRSFLIVFIKAMGLCAFGGLYLGFPGLCSTMVFHVHQQLLYVLSLNATRNIWMRYGMISSVVCFNTMLGMPSSSSALYGCSLEICQRSCALESLNLYLTQAGYSELSGRLVVGGLGGKKDWWNAAAFSSLVVTSIVMPFACGTFSMGMRCRPPSPGGFEM